MLLWCQCLLDTNHVAPQFRSWPVFGSRQLLQHSGLHCWPPGNCRRLRLVSDMLHCGPSCWGPSFQAATQLVAVALALDLGTVTLTSASRPSFHSPTARTQLAPMAPSLGCSPRLPCSPPFLWLRTRLPLLLHGCLPEHQLRQNRQTPSLFLSGSVDLGQLLHNYLVQVVICVLCEDDSDDPVSDVQLIVSSLSLSQDGVVTQPRFSNTSETISQHGTCVGTTCDPSSPSVQACDNRLSITGLVLPRRRRAGLRPRPPGDHVLVDKLHHPLSSTGIGCGAAAASAVAHLKIEPDKHHTWLQSQGWWCRQCQWWSTGQSLRLARSSLLWSRCYRHQVQAPAPVLGCLSTAHSCDATICTKRRPLCQSATSHQLGNKAKTAKLCP